MNTIDDWKTTATATDPRRAEFWKQVFGTTTVPIKSIVPSCASVPGNPNAVTYELDLRAISTEQRRRLVEALAEEFEIDVQLVEDNLEREGVPVLADHVAIWTTEIVPYL